MPAQARCEHEHVVCINHHELIRKYRCSNCGGIMICACDEEIGRRCLPHQLDRARVYGTHDSLPVTLGFVRGICNACRGVPEEPHPMAESYGRTSKIKRYYWREIGMETLSRFDKWARSQGYAGWMQAATEHAKVRGDIERQVVTEIKVAHESSPKYAFQEDSQDEVIRRHQVDTIALQGTYVRQTEGLAILDGEDCCSPEEFAARHFRRLGYQALLVESRPFHVLFGVFMWSLIQDPDDPCVHLVGFGDRNAFERKERGAQIRTMLPQDFGAPSYAERRADAVEEHFRSLGQDKEQLIWLFKYWIGPSEPLRQYLWAHRETDLARALQVLEILPADVILSILRFMLDDYWGRYLGWPDLLCHRDGEFFFAEVKSSKDKLSENQKNWIRLNALHLHLLFKLVKIHKVRTASAGDMTG